MLTVFGQDRLPKSSLLDALLVILIIMTDTLSASLEPFDKI
jgi:hypothetical protein